MYHSRYCRTHDIAAPNAADDILQVYPSDTDTIKSIRSGCLENQLGKRQKRTRVK